MPLEIVRSDESHVADFASMISRLCLVQMNCHDVLFQRFPFSVTVRTLIALEPRQMRWVVDLFVTLQTFRIGESGGTKRAEVVDAAVDLHVLRQDVVLRESLAAHVADVVRRLDRVMNASQVVEVSLPGLEGLEADRTGLLQVLLAFRLLCLRNFVAFLLVPYSVAGLEVEQKIRRGAGALELFLSPALADAELAVQELRLRLNWNLVLVEKHPEVVPAKRFVDRSLVAVDAEG